MKLLSVVMMGALSFSGACSSPKAAPAAAPAQPRQLDPQVDQLAEQILSGLAFQNIDKVAVVEFPGLDGRVSNFGKYLAEELTTRLVRSGRCQIVERRLLDKLLAEQKLDASGLIDEATASRLGRVLGAGAILAGTIADLDTSVKVNARMIETATGSVFAVATLKLPMDPELAALLGKPADKPASDPGSFDGDWVVRIDCEAQGGALGYTVRMAAQVQGGILHGQWGAEGVAPCLTLDGRIKPDGHGVILASGLAGDPKYNLHRYQKGLPISYHIEAVFAGAQGTGHRLELRPCDVQFSRQ